MKGLQESLINKGKKLFRQGEGNYPQIKGWQPQLSSCVKKSKRRINPATTNCKRKQDIFNITI